MQAVPMVRVNAVVPFVQFLEANGAPVERMLQDEGLSPGIVTMPERLLALQQALAFLDRAARCEGLPDLGLRVGSHTRFEVLGDFARLIRGAGTLREALDRLIEAIPLHNSGDILWLAVGRKHAMLCHRFSFADVPGLCQGQSFTLTMMIAAIRAVLGRSWQPDEIHLPTGSADLRKSCEEMLGRPVFCSGDVTAVAFPRVLLAAPSRTAVFGEVKLAEGYGSLCATAPASDFAGSLRQAISTLLVSGYPPVDRTAKAAGLSVRTLQRRLADGGESYSRLVEAVRLESAVRMLRDGDSKFIDIAYELGYADPANFTRAFRRWTGMTPRAFQRRQPPLTAGRSPLPLLPEAS